MQSGKPRDKSLPFILFGIVSLVLVLGNAEVRAQAITIAPRNPTISVGQPQQFTATGVGTATAIEAGSFHSCARLVDGTLRCWGLNDFGQLGDGTTTNSSTPVAVAGVAGAAAVSGGGFHTCARFPDGTLDCWGRNDSGQLGDPATTTFSSATPVRVTGITNATSMSAGGFHACALLADGTVRCWGRNDLGQLGNRIVSPTADTPNPTPVSVSGITTAVAVAAGGWHTCALLQDGSVRCWGDNTWGELGNGAAINPNPPDDQQPVTPVPTPVTVSSITTAVAIEAGIYHMCATLRDGTLRCWGRGEEGRLGNGSTANSSTPTSVPGITPTVLAPGAEYTCVVLGDGTMRCWGDNNWGQLGNDSPQGSVSPTPSGPVTGIANPIGASSGAEHSCALLQDGSVRCWGRNDDGRVGVAINANGTRPCPSSPSCAFTPVQVDGLGGGVTWTSSDTNVATIDANGLATGRNPGSTTIIATSGDRSGNTTLTVVSRPTLSLVREGTGSGTVASSPPGIDCGATCSASYNQNTPVTLTAAPATGSFFEGWNGGDCPGTATCTVTLTANTTVVARFTVPSTTRVDFDNPPPPGTIMNGAFQGIDFGTGQWAESGPYSVNATNHIYFADSTGTSRTFRFSPAPRVLDSIRVYSVTPGTLTLSDDTGQTFTREVTTGSLQFVTTGWAQPATTVTVSFTNGWDLGVDDITYSTAP